MELDLKEIERRKKISETLKRKYEEGLIERKPLPPETMKLRVEQMKEANIERYKNMTMEEKKAIVKNANSELTTHTS